MKPHLLNYQCAPQPSPQLFRRIAAMFALILVFGAHAAAFYFLYPIEPAAGFWMPALIAFGLYASILQFACIPQHRTSWMPLHIIFAGILSVFSVVGGLMLVVNKYGS